MSEKARAPEPSIPTVSDPYPRGCGLTYRAIGASKDGEYYIVHNRGMIPYCQQLLRKQGRSEDALKFITLDDIDSGVLRGTSEAKNMDHYAFDVATKAQVLGMLYANEQETNHAQD